MRTEGRHGGRPYGSICYTNHLTYATCRGDLRVCPWNLNKKKEMDEEVFIWGIGAGDSRFYL